MAISLYDIIQAIIITSVVTISAAYIAAIFYPQRFRQYRYRLFSRLGWSQRLAALKDTNTGARKSPCTHCSICPGCHVENSKETSQLD